MMDMLGSKLASASLEHKSIEAPGAEVEIASRDRLIHELFVESVRRAPNLVAVKYSDKSLTYGELNQKGDQLARYLFSRGVRPGQIVGLCVDRSLEMIVALLGILKAGGAYLPLDPNYPIDRLRYMLRDADPRVVLIQESLRAALSDCASNMIDLNEALGVSREYDLGPLHAHSARPCGNDLVYIIYTSGSTGRPKGTAMPHAPVANLIEWHRRTFGVCEGCRVLQFAALSFDVAFQETFSTLCSGGVLVLLDERVRRDPAALFELLSRESIERLFVPPLVLQALAEVSHVEDVPLLALKDVIVAGETLRLTSEIKKFFEPLRKCRLHNHYGPTETHVVTSFTLTGSAQNWPELPPIGLPISDVEIYLLNERSEPVPVGVAGEIYIGGAVARGYLKRPDQTASRFVANSLSTSPGERLYRTGDWGRRRADGVLEFLGRQDGQVKVRGFRVELGEIETQLGHYAQVKEAVVLARRDETNTSRLIAYFTRVPEADVPTAGALRSFLVSILPEYMIPSAFVHLEAFPLSPNGKLDRDKLPEPCPEDFASADYEEPQGDAERTLARIWSELLQLDRVGRQDDFFELGGHSLLIVQLLENLRRVGLSAVASDIYSNPTLAELGQALTRQIVPSAPAPFGGIPPYCEAITPEMLPLVALEREHIESIARSVPGGAANIEDIYPLAPLQEGILFHHVLDERRGDTYILPTALLVSDPRRLEALIAALERVIERHQVLRTAVFWEGLPKPVQVVYRRASLTTEYLVLDRDRSPLMQLREWMRPENLHIELRHAPLMRLQIASTPVNDQRYVLLLMHHLISDHDAMEVMISEVRTCLEGRAHELPASIPYRDHVVQVLAIEKTRDTQRFFRKKLGDVQDPTISFALASLYGNGDRIGEARQRLDSDLVQSVRSQTRRLGMSAAALFHAAWALVVAHTCGRDDVVYGSLFSGRMQGTVGSQRALGMFINTLPLRVRLRGMTAEGLTRQVQAELVELLRYEQASLAVAQRCSGVSGSPPLFNSLFNYLHSKLNLDTQRVTVFPGIEILETQERTNYPLSLSVDDQNEQIILISQTDLCIDPRRVLSYMIEAVRSLVTALAQSLTTPALALSVLPTAERRMLTETFNVSRVEFPQQYLIQELFEQQAQRTPNTIAVSGTDGALTYAELNGRANQLARHLLRRGIGPEKLVVLCLGPGLEMAIAILGTLKAGGAYVPLDPRNPPDRLALLLKDVAPQTVVTQRSIRSRLPLGVLEMIAIDADWRQIAGLAKGDLDAHQLGMVPQNLAYVIFTSGSTGMPKGVMVEHHSVVNHWRASEHHYSLSKCRRICVNAPYTFDTFVEQFMQLLSGSTLYLPSRDEILDASLLLQFLDRHRIEEVDCTPSQLVTWMEAGLLQRRTHQLRTLIVGGEAIDVVAWRQLACCSEFTSLNTYGPTECTIESTFTRIDDPAESPHIGRPLANVRIHIVDPHYNPVPLNSVGEICIGGAGVARGYLNRPELTAERFVADPFGEDEPSRLYKSGDLGRWRANVTIEYLGRNDHQVKIRGYRIELGEIEALLTQHPQVREAVVLALEDGVEKRLVAYILPERTAAAEKRLSAEVLSQYLRALLPNYMVPSAFVALEFWPLTSSGKLDRRALPRPALESYVVSEYEEPEGEIECAVAEIWRALLRLDRVGRYDNFFELGGNSLSAMQMMGRIRSTLLVEVPLSSLFEFPTVRQLSTHLDSLREAQIAELLAEQKVHAATMGAM